MAAIASGRPVYTFDLGDWTDEVDGAVVVCPHAVTHNLTPWEIEVLDTNQMRKRALPKNGKNALRVCLDYEFQYFNDLKQKISGNTLNRTEFNKSGFNVVYAILKNIFSAHNPHLLHALLQLPERAQFTNGRGVAALFGSGFIAPDRVQQIFGMIRRRYAQRGLTAEENAVITAYLRMKPVQNPSFSLRPQTMGGTGSTRSRGGKIGLAALHEPLPLAGRHAGTNAASEEFDGEYVDDFEDEEGGEEEEEEEEEAGAGSPDLRQAEFVAPVKNNLMLL